MANHIFCTITINLEKVITQKTEILPGEILGDSHTRHIAGLVGKLTGPRNKPACCTSSRHRTVHHLRSTAIAGTNDVAAGKEEIIYKYMEGILQQLSSSSKVLVATLPHRHDLAPDNATNRTIRMVNGYITELCNRHKDVRVLEVNCIRRPNFTAHGMHLRMCGKRVLARLIARRLADFGSCENHQQLNSAAPSPVAVQPVEPMTVVSTPSRPVPLPETPGPAPSRLALVSTPACAMTRTCNKTYAEAVTSCSPATSSPVNSDKADCVFYGPHRRPTSKID
ncbi:hypothetical protein J6590_002269 [Homalodisca vitripennis]|nr:hypothetical protein J6590_002269 [Homalodisca vitripennis]